MVKIKDDQGHFTYLSKVVAMIAGTVTLLIAIGGAAFSVDARYVQVVQVQQQFKSIQDSRQVADLQNALALTQIRLDILEDRLFREQQKQTSSNNAYIRKLESDIQRLRKQSDAIYEKLLEQ